MDGDSSGQEREVSFSNPKDDLFNDVGKARSEEEIPRPKRIACVICRRRKLRCDGAKPACGTCTRLGHDCAYDEIRRKSGPKRGYVKALEARLAQVETLLKSKEHVPKDNTGPADPEALYPSAAIRPGDPLDDIPLEQQLLSLEVDEPLPAQDVMDELYELWFEKMFPTCPMIHKGKFMTSLGFSPKNQPPLSLRYAIWASAAGVSPKYKEMQTHFYKKARKYSEDAELRGHGETIISIYTVQAWITIASYEFRCMYFPRAWMSTGRACRLAQMLGLHKIDTDLVDIKQVMPPPKDWLEREERRRTFWMTFCIDRYASIGTGWPMCIEEKDISTHLPCSEEAFQLGRPESAPVSIKEAMTPEGAAFLSPYSGVILMASVFGRILLHLHRPEPDEKPDDPNSTFWKRHRQLDQMLSKISLSLPYSFKLPNNLRDGNVVFTNMNIHAGTICLHQAAIFRAKKVDIGMGIMRDSEIRCLASACEIASIMRMVSHLDVNLMHPFLSFCVYVGARVFIQYLKNNPEDENIHSQLEFLNDVLMELKRLNPLTESFIVQLEVDIGGDLDNPSNGARFPYGLRKGQAEIYVDHRDASTKANKHISSLPKNIYNGTLDFDQMNHVPREMPPEYREHNPRGTCGASAFFHETTKATPAKEPGSYANTNTSLSAGSPQTVSDSVPSVSGSGSAARFSPSSSSSVPGMSPGLASAVPQNFPSAAERAMPGFATEKETSSPMSAQAYAQMLSEEFSKDMGMPDWNSLDFEGTFLPQGADELYFPGFFQQ